MEFELNRDKGYGGYKEKMAQIKKEKQAVQESSGNASTGSDSGSDSLERSGSDEGDDEEGGYSRGAANEVNFVFGIVRLK